MAKFVGTIQEFHDYIGPRIRNKVNYAARGERLARNGVCQHCGQTAELQSAHVHGRGRRDLIEGVLTQFMGSGKVVSCNLEVVESAIIQAHLPIEETFLFLCQECHRKYDSSGPGTAQRTCDQRVTVPSSPIADFPKLHKISIWARRPNQVNHRIIRAFLDLDDGTGVPFEELSERCRAVYGIDNLHQHLPSMMTDAGNSHGRVFRRQGNQVLMWPSVREEVDIHFER